MPSTTRRHKRSLSSYNDSEDEDEAVETNELETNNSTNEVTASSSSSSQKSRSIPCSNKRQKQMNVMSQSGQSETQRRELRNNQRQLYQKMTDSSLDIGDKMCDVDSDHLDKVRSKNNILWEHVRFTREAVLDGDNFDVITNKAARQVDKLISVSIHLWITSDCYSIS